MPFTTPNMLINSNVYTSSTVETASLVTGSSPQQFGCKLLGFISSNASGSSGWVQLFDGYAAPSSGSKPILSVQTGAGLQSSLDCSVFNCVDCKLGIVLVLSSTLATYTPISNGLFNTVFWIQ